jgi:glyoxylase-like metal-dependent hydrolase (beta-lactamase superfamily II)
MTARDVFLKVFNDPHYAENGVILSLSDGRPCWIIDPGLPPQAKEMLAYLADHELTPEAIVLTHAHGDHIAGIDELRGVHANLPVYLAKNEWPLLTDPMENLSGHHGPGVTAQVSDPRDLAPGDTLTLDGTVWTVRDTSGHSPAGRTIYCAELKLAFVGDAVFAGSVGRVDFHHSDGPRLARNIRENILTLPDDTTLITGHGPATTVAAERAHNPYLQDDAWLNG